MPSPETDLINVLTFDFRAAELIFSSSCDVW